MRRRSFKVQTVANQMFCVLIIGRFVELGRDVGLQFTIVIKVKYFRKTYPTAVFFVISRIQFGRWGDNTMYSIEMYLIFRYNTDQMTCWLLAQW